MSIDALFETPHRRRNPLTGEWVLVSPHRTQRPWQGQVERATIPAALRYDPNCYLCPGNDRSGGERNPVYESTFVFINDFAALLPGSPQWKDDKGGRGLMSAEGEAGTCKVMCFSPRHDLTLSRMSIGEIQTVIDMWAVQYAELGSQKGINHVQIFENRGDMMGCSNPHPHCQIWATQTIPNEPQKELENQRKYADSHGSCLLCDYLALEGEQNRRIVCENEHFIAFVPFWALWPFETMIISKRHAQNLAALSGKVRGDLADILKRLTTRYDNLFETLFPYSMGFHQSPTDGESHDEWHLHAHFYPPLLRSATVKKFMVGFEMLGTPQRDITPEAAADRLRGLSELHYLERL